MSRWRTECELSDKLMKMGKYLLLLTALKPRTVFNKWRDWALAEKAGREKVSCRSARRTKRVPNYPPLVA